MVTINLNIATKPKPAKTTISGLNDVDDCKGAGRWGDV
jgi:hypothetical protein